jgi:predicted lipoprotein with Yx(FWY)xxD motif
MSFLSIRTILGGLVAAISALALLTTAAPAAVLQANDNPWFGPVLTDDAGISVYVIELGHDCIGECLLLWTPVPFEAATAVDPDLTPELISSIGGPGETIQVTYDGHPLFYFTEDFVEGDVNGHHFYEFGYASYLIAPTGDVLRGNGTEECECHQEVAEY